ncbi:hypothetical protein J6590_099626 [Homalodisca vitripennis]|nr:hypothetical protein J6590_099626 [Homalodisca vitripennis]
MPTSKEHSSGFWALMIGHRTLDEPSTLRPTVAALSELLLSARACSSAVPYRPTLPYRTSGSPAVVLFLSVRSTSLKLPGVDLSSSGEYTIFLSETGTIPLGIPLEGYSAPGTPEIRDWFLVTVPGVSFQNKDLEQLTPLSPELASISNRDWCGLVWTLDTSLPDGRQRIVTVDYIDGLRLAETKTIGMFDLPIDRNSTMMFGTRERTGNNPVVQLVFINAVICLVNNHVDYLHIRDKPSIALDLGTLEHFLRYDIKYLHSNVAWPDCRELIFSLTVAFDGVARDELMRLFGSAH